MDLKYYMKGTLIDYKNTQMYTVKTGKQIKGHCCKVVIYRTGRRVYKLNPLNIKI
jgi:hypothetical protein